MSYIHESSFQTTHREFSSTFEPFCPRRCPQILQYLCKFGTNNGYSPGPAVLKLKRNDLIQNKWKNIASKFLCYHNFFLVFGIFPITMHFLLGLFLAQIKVP